MFVSPKRYSVTFAERRRLNERVYIHNATKLRLRVRGLRVAELELAISRLRTRQTQQRVTTGSTSAGRFLCLNNRRTGHCQPARLSIVTHRR